jgi:hypothetical protein
MNDINIILIVLLIHYIGFLINKNSKNRVLACGLFAWAGKSPDQFSEHKFDILGILNETRGKHSCGVTTDGHIYKGVDTEKIFRDFIATSGYKKPTKFPVVIGHTRHSTVGVHSLDNTHPFGFGFNKKHKSNQFIGVHNGTLLNHTEIATMNDIKATRQSVSNPKLNVSKIDSEIILETIYRNKNYKVLSQYNGAAALIFTNVDEPNVIYCYHGASKKHHNSKTDDIWIERPLFYYKESATSLYISSLDDSLRSIGADDRTLGEFECNVVYKIKNGNINRATKFSVSRFNNFSQRGSKYKTSQYSRGSEYEGACGYNRSAKYRKNKKVINLPLNNKSENPFDLRFESLPKGNINKYAGKIYFNKLRYYRNGHLINGIYCYVPNVGFRYLADSIKDATSTFQNLIGKTYSSKSELFLDAKTSSNMYKKNIISDDNQHLYTIPFPANKYTNISDDEYMHFMYKGINLSLKSDYEQCIAYNETVNEFGVEELSCCSKHPVLDLEATLVKGSDNAIIKDYILAEGAFSPLGSERVYEIEEGTCINFSLKYETIKHQTTLDLNEAAKSLEEDLKKEEAKKTALENADLTASLIEEIFTPLYKTFPSEIKRLTKYKDNEEASKALTILNSFMLSTTKLITLEKK